MRKDYLGAILKKLDEDKKRLRIKKDEKEEIIVKRKQKLHSYDNPFNKLTCSEIEHHMRKERTKIEEKQTLEKPKPLDLKKNMHQMNEKELEAFYNQQRIKIERKH